MPDLKDELDALFEDDGEPQAEEATEETAEEQAEETAEDGKTDGKAKSGLAKKSKMVGARTGAIVAGRKLPGKATVAAKPTPKAAEPESESEEPAPSHVTRGRVAPTLSSGGGSSKLLVASLVLNVVVLVLLLLVVVKTGTIESKVQENATNIVTVGKNVTASAMISRAQVGVYTDRGGADTAVLFYLPQDVNEFPAEGKAWKVSLDKLIQNATRK